MSSAFESIFARLRTILQNHAGGFSVTDTPDRYCLEGVPGPAALRAWAGTMKKRLIPVAWGEIGKSYVGYHVMGVLDNSKLRDGMSKELRARMHGKTCFNFKIRDEALFKELEQLTARGLAGFMEAGFISEEKSPSAARDVPARH